MLITVETTQHRFGVLGIHDLQAKLKEKGEDLARGCLVVEICQPAAAQEAAESR